MIEQELSVSTNEKRTETFPGVLILIGIFFEEEKPSVQPYPLIVGFYLT